MAENSTVLEVGARVGDTYEVVRLIGRGGMGEVWAARHLRLPGKEVAVKVLHTRAGGLSEEALTRFRREAEVATRIGHPNIVEVHDFNTLPSGAPYLVLELLQGESLASRLRFGPISIEETTLLLRQVSSALDASHQQGVVHRDLKPDNIFLVPTPMGTQVKVLDFGISKVVDSSTLQTADEVLVGTPQYMSPEQATGQNKDVGPQTDVFALGSIAYEMLTGQPPFVADSVAKMVFRIAYEPHVPLAQVKPGLEPRVYQAVERALQKDRAKRFESIADFIAAFSGQPVARTVPPPQSQEPSGVARPGMATPESMAWGATSVHTPAPVPVPKTADAPVVPTAPARRSALPFVALGVAAVAGVVAVLILNPLSPRRGEGQGEGVVEQPKEPPKPVPPPQPEPIPVPAPAPPAPAEAKGGVEPATPPPPPVATKSALKKIPAEDAAVIADMTQRLKEKNALERVRQLFNSVKSESGLQRAYAIAGIAACKERDLGNARTYLDKLNDRAEKQYLLSECKTRGMEVVE